MTTIRKTGLGAALALAASLAAAEAATLTATSKIGLSDWSAEFDDLNGDRLFSIDEMTSFSGVGRPRHARVGHTPRRACPGVIVST